MKVTISRSKQFDCWQLFIGAERKVKNVDSIVEVDAILWALRLMSPACNPVVVADKTADKLFSAHDRLG